MSSLSTSSVTGRRLWAVRLKVARTPIDSTCGQRSAEQTVVHSGVGGGVWGPALPPNAERVQTQASFYYTAM